MAMSPGNVQLSSLKEPLSSSTDFPCAFLPKLSSWSRIMDFFLMEENYM